MADRNNSYLGTYFDKDSVFRIVWWLNIASWAAVIVYGGQFLLSLTVYVLQLARGMMYVMGPTDLAQQILWFAEPNYKGIAYFVLLQAVGKLLLIFMDVEDNTRRAARK